MNTNDVLYNTVIQPIVERLMEANEVGREYAERFVIDTVHNTIADFGLSYESVNAMVDEAVRGVEYEFEQRIEGLEYEVAVLASDVAALAAALDETNRKSSGSWFTRLFR